MKKVLFYLFFCFIALGLSLITISNSYSHLSLPYLIVSVVSANIDGVGDISDGSCTVDSPCSGLTRGAKLHLRINVNGYAAAYLQDEKGSYYNQEGRLFIKNSTAGTIKLWPGTPNGIGHKTFRLYVVTNHKKIPTYKDSKPLDELPDGKVWGPKYLTIVNQDQ